MKSTLVHKHAIAKEFMEAAVRLYDEKKYFSSLHLAGAAEEIYHDTLKDRGVESAKEASARLAKGLGDVIYKNSQPSKSGIERVMDRSKNSVKHVKKENKYIYEVLLRAQVDSFRMIRRGIKNARLLNIELGSTFNEFMSRNELDIHRA